MKIWQDPEYVAKRIAERPGATFYCVNKWKENNYEKRRRLTCLTQLEVREGLFHCPIHGTEIAEETE